MAKANDNLQSRVVAWLKGRNTSGVNGTALLLEAFQYIEGHGDKTILARIASIQEQSTAKNVKRVMEAFGFKPVADKKQPSGIRVDRINKDEGKWSLADHAPALAKLQRAVDEGLSIAGKKIASAEYFMTDKERDAAARREAEKEAEAEATPEPEADATPEPEAAPVEAITEDDAIAEIESLFVQLSTDAMQPLLNRLAEVYQAAMAAQIDAMLPEAGAEAVAA